MPNEKNLKPNTERTPKERKELARKAGIASGQKRRELKAFKEYILEGLKTEITDKQGNKVSAKQAGALKVIKKFVEGDYKFVELVLKVLSEMPAEKQEIIGDLSVAPTSFNILPVKGNDEV